MSLGSDREKTCNHPVGMSAGSDQRYFDSVRVGDALPPLVKRPSTVMLFRFSAVTWNAHRIHYDQDYASSEAHPGVLVQATMHGAFLAQMLSAYVGPAGHIVSLSYENRGRAVAGDVLKCEGVVVRIDDNAQHVYCDVTERGPSGQVCARGEATIFLPSGGAS